MDRNGRGGGGKCFSGLANWLWMYYNNTTLLHTHSKIKCKNSNKI